MVLGVSAAVLAVVLVAASVMLSAVVLAGCCFPFSL